MVESGFPTYPLKLAGAFGSPYSIKMRAVLRYRRAPYRWIFRGSAEDDLGAGPVAIIPAVGFPDASGGYDEVAVDSSPLIMRLEGMVDDRRLVPTDPVVAFLDYLIEDFGDEWVTKAMYHYRWYYDADVHKAGLILPLDHDEQCTPEMLVKATRFITERQVGRMALVGSTDQNRPVIEGSFQRLVDLMEARLVESPFLLGTRPGRGDFGIFGQFSQLVAFDPVPRDLVMARAPRVVHWVMGTDDLSWLPVDGDLGWIDRADLEQAVGPLFGEIGRTYAPFMVANADALAGEASEVVCEIDGTEYRQAPFRYQGKCLDWLRAEREALTEADRSVVDGLLAGTGCERLFV